MGFLKPKGVIEYSLIVCNEKFECQVIIFGYFLLEYIQKLIGQLLLRDVEVRIQHITINRCKYVIRIKEIPTILKIINSFCEIFRVEKGRQGLRVYSSR
ncbi:hypothetical protein DVK06_15210 [Halorubrum sp. Atlit-28R]|nr:hypothetical protein DVK06_15210 [Halorubrum sp. Atlit-28R]